MSDDSQYVFDLPIEFKKSDDNIIGFKISSLDVSKFGFVNGTPQVFITAPNTAAPISFANIAFNVSYTFYSLQNDVSYNTYPFATSSKPKHRLLFV